MISELYLEILALDSLYGVLSWYERAWLHLLSNKKQEGNVSERIIALYMIVKGANWEIPKKKIGHDRLGQYYENGKWNDDEQYPRNHPEITRMIKQIQK